jgi:hypothetical protein
LRKGMLVRSMISMSNLFVYFLIFG